MNLPNVLTVLRIVLTVVFVFFMNRDESVFKLWALVVFTAAAATDFLDGYYARSRKMITRFGKIMDPIADKFLMLSAFYIFTRIRVYPNWIFILIFIREIVVTGLRLNAMRAGVTLAAEKGGKIKTVLQISAVYFIMAFLIAGEHGLGAPTHGRVIEKWPASIFVLMLVVAGVTISSGFSVIWNSRKEIFHAR